MSGFLALAWVLTVLIAVPAARAAEGIGEEIMVRPNRVWLVMADAPPLEGEPNTAAGWQQVPGKEGWQREWAGPKPQLPISGWYRIEFVVDDEAVRRNWIASAGFVGNQSELFFNGVRLGNFGRPGTLVPLPQRTLHALPLPPSSLRPGTNWLDIRFHNDAGVGGLLGGAFGLVPSEEFPAVRSRSEFGRELFRGFVGGVSILAGIGAFAALWVTRGGRLPALTLPLLLLGIQNLTHSQALMGRPGTAIVRTLTTALLPLAMYWLCRRLVGRHRPTDLAVLVFAGIDYLLGFFAFPNPKAIQGLFGLLLMFCGGAMLFSFLRNRRRLDVTAKAFAASLLAFGAAAGWDMSLRSVPSLPWSALWWDPVDWAALFFIVSNGWVLLFHDVRLGLERDTIARRLIRREEDARKETAQALRLDADTGAGDIKRILEEIRSNPDPARKEPLFGDLSAGVSQFQRRLHKTAESLEPLQGISLETAIHRFEVAFRARFRIPLYVDLPRNLVVETSTAELVFLTVESVVEEMLRGSTGRSARIAVRQADHHLELRIEAAGGNRPDRTEGRATRVSEALDRIRWRGGSVVESDYGDSGYLLVATIPAGKRAEDQ